MSDHPSTLDEVYLWAVNEVGIDTEYAQILKQNKVNGKQLRLLTKQDFIDCGIPGLVSGALANAVLQLKDTLKATPSPPVSKQVSRPKKLKWSTNPDANRPAAFTWDELSLKTNIELYSLVGPWGINCLKDRQLLTANEILYTIYQAIENETESSVSYYSNRITAERKATANEKEKFKSVVQELRQVAASIPYQEEELKKILGAAGNSKTVSGGRTLMEINQMLTEESNQIIIFGNLKAGKSLFIDTLLGLPFLVLPSAGERCTSCVCELSFGEESIFCKNTMNTPTPRLGNEQEWSTLVKKQLASETNRRNPESFKYQIKSAILETGINILDSPGLNENGDLDEQVASHTTRAMCMIVVINGKDGAITASVAKLLNALKEQKHFDPRRLLFLITHFDVVVGNPPVMEKWEKAKFAMSKGLTEIFPGLEPDLIPINTEAAFQAQCVGYVTPQLKEVYKHVIAHIVNGRKFNLQRVYREMMEFFDYCHKPVKLFLLVLTLASSEKQSKIDELSSKFKKFQGIIDKLLDKMVDKRLECVNKVIQPALDVLTLERVTSRARSISVFAPKNTKNPLQGEEDAIEAKVKKAVSEILQLELFGESKNVSSNSSNSKARDGVTSKSKTPLTKEEREREATVKRREDWAIAKAKSIEIFEELAKESSKLVSDVNEVENLISLRSTLTLPKDSTSFFDRNENLVIAGGILGAIILAPLTILAMLGVGITYGIKHAMKKNDDAQEEKKKHLYITDTIAFLDQQYTVYAKAWLSKYSEHLQAVLASNLNIMDVYSSIAAELASLQSKIKYSVKLLDHFPTVKNFAKSHRQTYLALDDVLTKLTQTTYKIGFCTAPSDIKFPFLDIPQNTYNGSTVVIVKQKFTTIDIAVIETIYQDVKAKIGGFYGYIITPESNGWEIIFIFRAESHFLPKYKKLQFTTTTSTTASTAITTTGTTLPKVTIYVKNLTSIPVGKIFPPINWTVRELSVSTETSATSYILTRFSVSDILNDPKSFFGRIPKFTSNVFLIIATTNTYYYEDEESIQILRNIGMEYGISMFKVLYFPYSLPKESVNEADAIIDPVISARLLVQYFNSDFDYRSE